MAARGTRAWPYRRIPAGPVQSAPWTIDPDTEDERELPSALPDWDYRTALRIRRRLSIDVPACREATGVPVDVPLAVSVRWNAVPSLLRGSAALIPLHDDVREYVVDADIPGERVGGIVHLETIVVLAAPGEARPAVAHLVGSALWDDAVSVRLQGDAPLFPTALIPFAASGLPDRAAWFVELGADLHAAALGAIQLLVNEEHALVAAAIGRVAKPSDAEQAVLSALRSDVVRTMLERALGDEEFTMTVDYGKDSLGSVLQGLLRTFLPTYQDEDGLLEIRRIRAGEPPLFAAVVQSATELMANAR